MKKFNIFIKYSLFYSLFVFFVSVTISFLFWPNFIIQGPSDKTTAVAVNPGDWGFDIPVSPDKNLSDFAYEVFRSSALLNSINRPDPHGRNALYILGSEDDGTLKRPEGPFKTFDCFIWKTSKLKTNRIIIAQKIEEFDFDYVFTSWDTLNAASTNPNIGLTLVARYENDDKKLVGRYESGAVYSRGNAVIKHTINSVERKFLPRLQKSTLEPGVEPGWQEHWFEVSDTWLSQSYPEGTFIMHDNNHYIANRNTTSTEEPGVSDAFTRIEKFVNQQVVATYQGSTTYNLNDIVLYENDYYISRVNNNNAMPTNQSSWHQFSLFDKSDMVPTLGVHTGNNDEINGITNFVRHESNGVTNYYRQTGGYNNNSNNPVQDNWMWAPVLEYSQATNVAKWSPHINYGSGYVGLIVEYEDVLYQKTSSWVSTNVPPPSNGQAWVRINRWIDTQGPAFFQPGNNPHGQIYFVSEDFGYIASIRNTWPSANHLDNQCYQEVLEFSRSNRYKGYNNGFTGNNRNDPFFFTYIVNDDGSKTFYQVKDQPGNASFRGISPLDDNGYLYFQEVEFKNTHSTIAEKVSGRWKIYNLIDGQNPNTYPAFDTIGTVWELSEESTNEQFVYTIKDGAYKLWRNTTGGSATIAPGEIQDGVSHWENVPYRTRKPYVYYINDANVAFFWYSSTESNTTPVADSANWERLNYTSINVNPYVYVVNNDQSVTYFKTDNNLQTDEFIKLENGWIGPLANDNQMIYMWNHKTIYQEGDIVIFGTTLLNTYRYFRFRSNEYSTDAVGFVPFSSDGFISMYWEAVNVFYYGLTEDIILNNAMLSYNNFFASEYDHITSYRIPSHYYNISIDFVILSGSSVSMYNNYIHINPTLTTDNVSIRILFTTSNRTEYIDITFQTKLPDS